MLTDKIKDMVDAEIDQSYQEGLDEGYLLAIEAIIASTSVRRTTLDLIGRKIDQLIEDKRKSMEKNNV